MIPAEHDNLGDHFDHLDHYHQDFLHSGCAGFLGWYDVHEYDDEDDDDDDTTGDDDDQQRRRRRRR